jgi:hypothetical protein
MPERRPEQRPMQQRPIIGERDETQIVDIGQRVQVVIGQAQYERTDHRQQEEHAQHDGGRRQEQPRGALCVHGGALVIGRA